MTILLSNILTVVMLYALYAIGRKQSVNHPVFVMCALISIAAISAIFALT